MTWTVTINNAGTWICLIVFGCSFLLLALYYALIYWRVARKKSIADTTAEGEKGLVSRYPKVSVVIAAHNEAEFLKESMPYLLEQDYPNYEVVVVDYMSEDDTKFVLKVCSENYSNLKPIQFPEDVNMFQGKKYPLSIGIKSATGDIIVMTEATSVPHGFNWISSLVRLYEGGETQIVAGYGSLRPGKGLLHALQQYDTLSDTTSWMGFQMMGMPYSATGRNLTFRRQFFFDCGSFISHYTIPDGADDLFVNQNATRTNMRLCLERDGSVDYDPQPSFAAWRKQRKQRYGTRRFYPFHQKLLLALRPLAVVLLYLAAAALVLQNFPWQYLVFAWVLLEVWQVFAIAQVTRRFEARKVYWVAPFFEIYFTISHTIIRIFTLYNKKSNRWK